MAARNDLVAIPQLNNYSAEYAGDSYGLAQYVGDIAGKTGIAAAIALLRKFGSDAHLWLPGVGTLNGLTCGNYLDSAGTTLGTVDNPVGLVNDALGGINATQSTTANKPVLRRGLVNLLTYSSDFSQSAWALIQTASKASSTTINTPATNDYIYQSLSAATYAGKQITVAFSLSGAGSVVLGTYDNVSALQTDLITLTSTPTIYTKTVTIGAGAADVRAIVGRIGVATATSFSCTESGAFQGTLTAQQILDNGGIPLTTTAAASNASAGKYSWQFDGTNDSLALGSVPFQTNDDVCIVAGSAPASDIAAGSKIFGIRGVSGNSIIHMSVEVAQSVSYQFRDEALANNVGQSAASAFVAGNAMVSSVKKVGNNAALRINGVSAYSSAVAVGASTFSTNLPNIGSENASKYFKGSIGPVIAIKGTVTDADLLLLERFVAALTPNAPTF